MNDTMTYEEKCAEAASAQGLDPIIEAFALADMSSRLNIEQTGGWCMVAVVYADRSCNAWVSVTDEGPGEPAYLVRAFSHSEDDGFVYQAGITDPNKVVGIVLDALETI